MNIKAKKLDYVLIGTEAGCQVYGDSLCYSILYMLKIFGNKIIFI